jgi:hypothetical protein
MWRRIVSLVGIVFLVGPIVYVAWLSTTKGAGDYWAFVQKNYLVFFGMPYAAFFSYYLVSFLETRSGDIEVEFFTLKFKGAAGPLVFWLLVFLAILLGFKLFWTGP